MIKDLIKVASELDKLGLIKEANLIDLLIKKVASGDKEVTFKDIGMDKLKNYSDEYRNGITYHELGAVVILGRDNPGLFVGDRLNPVGRYITQDGREITGTIKSVIEGKKAIVVLPDNAVKRPLLKEEFIPLKEEFTPLKEEFIPSSNIKSLQEEVKRSPLKEEFIPSSNIKSLQEEVESIPNKMMVEEVSSSISDEREKEIAERAEYINELPLRFRNINAQEIKDVRDAKSAEEKKIRSKYYPDWTKKDFDNLLSRINISINLF